jgi:hypothetical protein
MQILDVILVVLTIVLSSCFIAAHVLMTDSKLKYKLNAVFIGILLIMGCVSLLVRLLYQNTYDKHQIARAIELLGFDEKDCIIIADAVYWTRRQTNVSDITKKLKPLNLSLKLSDDQLALVALNLKLILDGLDYPALHPPTKVTPEAVPTEPAAPAKEKEAAKAMFKFKNNGQYW